MHLRTLAPLVAVLALAACGEEETAEAPATPTPPTATETARSPSPPPAPPASSTAAGSGTTQPGDTGGTNTTAPPATGATQTAAAPAELQTFQGRTYSAGPVSLRLNPDNTFVMNEVDGSLQVEGRYAYEDGVLTLSQPTGTIGPAIFPMRCRLQPGAAAGEFRLAETEGSCTRFKDVTFRPAEG